MEEMSDQLHIQATLSPSTHWKRGWSGPRDSTDILNKVESASRVSTRNFLVVHNVVNSEYDEYDTNRH